MADIKPPVEDYNGAETNLRSIATQICAEPPKPPQSYQLELDHESEQNVEFEMVQTLTRAFMDRLFGSNCNPLNLTEENRDLINQYLKSVGYQVTFHREETENYVQMTLSFERYRSSKPNPWTHLKKYMS